MDTFEAIRERRAMKWFDPKHRFTPEEEEFILDLAKESPSSFNAQHWRLVRVSDVEIRKAIRAAAFDQSQVTDASLLYVVCADTKAWQKEGARYYRNAPKEVRDILVPFSQTFHEYNEQLQRDEALRSGSFIAHTIMLTVKAMGYDSCPMIGFDAKEVSKIIKLPDNHVIVMMLALGKGTREPWPKPGYIDQSEWVFENSF